MYALSIAMVAWLIAQISKVLTSYLKKRKFDLYALVAPGGMPSSHTSFVVALAMRIGIIDGFGSTTFAMAAAFALIVMYDAAGVRRAAGLQAQKINLLIDEFYLTHQVNEKRLREILGHTPLEVFGGIVLGGLIGLFWNLW
ncbi:MAG: divergent PAP2 family protein [Clostridia bacterium]